MELVVVLVIIAILSAILVVSVSGYIEKTNNTADIKQARDLSVALQSAAAFSSEGTINDHNPYENGDGFVYVSQQGIRISNKEVKDILVEEGFIKAGEADKYTLYNRVEFTYTKSQTNIYCQSRKAWNRYQINFKIVDGEIELSYTANSNSGGKDSQSKDVIAKDKEATENFAKRLNGTGKYVARG